jgi:gliding motility-associated-like protein
LSSGNNVSLCLGDSLVVSAFTVNGVLSSYIWYDLADSSVISTHANLTINTAGAYYVEATGPNGCSKTDTLVVTGLAVTANAGIDQAVDSGQVVQLGATGGISYYWYANSPVYFNNPFDPNAQTLPTMDTTTYYVEVTAANGCVSVDSMQVFINPKVPDPLEPYSDVQNVITPNGDGVNDLLDLSEVMDGDNCELRIMNRWGASVRVFSSYQNNWNGTDDGGDILPDGTYYYTLRCSSGVEFRIKGAVTILTGNSK